MIKRRSAFYPFASVRISGKDLFLNDELYGKIGRKGNTLKLTYADESNYFIIFDFLSSKEVPSSHGITTTKTDDPMACFKVFWHTFNEIYTLYSFSTAYDDIVGILSLFFH